MSNNKKYSLTDTERDVIFKFYDGKTENINKIMSLLNNKYPRWYIRNFAQINGLAREWGSGRLWTEEEIEFLEKQYAIKSIGWLSEKLKKSQTAIFVKKKRLHITKNGNGFTMCQVMNLLGCDHHKIRRWINLGWLKAKRKNTERTEAQGGDMWHIEGKDLRKFIINYWEQVDIRRVEKYYFIQLVAGRL